jgi:hypothetical protein
MNPRTSSSAAQLAGGGAIAAATFAAFAVAGEPVDGLIGAALVFGLMVVIVAGRGRSGTLDVLSGIGDERSRALYTRACAFAGTVMSFVLPGWWLVTVAIGDANGTLSLCAAIFAVSFVGAAVVLARRG